MAEHRWVETRFRRHKCSTCGTERVTVDQPRFVRGFYDVNGMFVGIREPKCTELPGAMGAAWVDCDDERIFGR